MGTVELGRVTAGLVTVYDANNNMKYDRGEIIAVEQEEADGITTEITERSFVQGALKELLGVTTLRRGMSFSAITKFARAKEQICKSAAQCHFKDIEPYIYNLFEAAHQLRLSFAVCDAQRDDAIERGAMQGVIASLMQSDLAAQSDDPWKALEWLDGAEQCAKSGNVPFSESVYAGLEPVFQKHYEQALVHATAAADGGDIFTMTSWLNTAEQDALRAKLPPNGPQVVEIRVKGYTKAYALAIHSAEEAIPEGRVDVAEEQLSYARSYAEQAKITYDMIIGKKILHDVCYKRTRQLLRYIVCDIAREQFLSAKNNFEMLLFYAQQGGVAIERALILQLDTEIRAGLAVPQAPGPRTWESILDSPPAP